MIRVARLTAGYGGSVVLREVTVEAAPGEVVCVMGRNGVGKTTLLKAIMGLLRPRSGKVYLDGRDVTSEPPHVRARRGVGYVPQGRGIFPYLTVHENLLIGFEATSRPPEADEIERVLELFPALRPLLRRLAGTLSGGQQQQLAIARVLVAKPRVLILDEPTEGIQPSTVLEIGAVIERLKREEEIAILLVEQFLDFALSLADRYYIMENGRVAADGDRAALDVTAVRDLLAV